MKLWLNDKTAINLATLIDSRLLVQANSGGGKSWLLRRLLEQSHGKVQQIVIDLEGEFSTLREKYDYILAGKGGDTPAEPRSAALLARKLLEMNVSAIIDLYELHHQERKHFVRLFLEAMINAPKELWHPCIVVIDEAHIFCPEKGQSEAMEAVIDLATRGRKRGYCAVLATQRLSKLHKDAAAECNNKLIGRTGLDVDMKRAAEELGFTTKDQYLSLRELEAGEFFAFGPAISRSVIKLRIGEVRTTHPRAGARMKSVVIPPTDAIKKVLGKLADLPQEAQKEARSVAELKAEIAELRRHRCPVVNQNPVKVERIEVPTIGKRALEGLKKAEAGMRRMLAAQKQANAVGVDQVAVIERHLTKLARDIQKVEGGVRVSGPPAPTRIELPVRLPRFEPKPTSNGMDGPVVRGERRILIAVAQHQEGVTREQLTVLTGYKRSSRDTYLQRLGARGLVAINGARVLATEEGIAALGSDFQPLPTGDALREHWMTRLPEGERKVLGILIEAYPEPVDRERISETTGYQRSSRDTYLQRLSARRLVMNEGRGSVRASKELFG